MWWKVNREAQKCPKIFTLIPNLKVSINLPQWSEIPPQYPSRLYMPSTPTDHFRQRYRVRKVLLPVPVSSLLFLLLTTNTTPPAPILIALWKARNECQWVNSMMSGIVWRILEGGTFQHKSETAWMSNTSSWTSLLSWKCVGKCRQPISSGHPWWDAIIVWCRYNAVNFLQNLHRIHPIARPLGRGMGCILWVQTVIYTLPQSLQWCMQNHDILDRVITTLDCTCLCRWYRLLA